MESPYIDALKNDKYFYSSEKDGVRIEYDFGLIEKHLNFPESPRDFALRHSIIDYSTTYKWLRKKRKEYDPDDDNDNDDEGYSFNVGNPTFVNEELYNYIWNLLADNDGKINSRLVGNVCKATIEIAKHLRTCKADEIINDYSAIKNECNETIAFINFLEIRGNDYLNVHKITIQDSATKGAKNVMMPATWLDAFVCFFKLSFGENYVEDSKKYLEQSKAECIAFLNMYPTEKIRINRIIGCYAVGLDSLLQNFEIESANKRHGIIGHIFCFLGIIPKKQKLNKSKLTKAYADWVLKSIERVTKV